MACLISQPIDDEAVTMMFPETIMPRSMKTRTKKIIKKKEIPLPQYRCLMILLKEEGMSHGRS